MIKLSIIILTYNTKVLTSNCVNLLINKYSKELKEGSLEIIVCDNGSKDETVLYLSKIKEIKVVDNKNNFGFAKGNNLAVEKAKGEYILFLNSDCEIKDNKFLNMIKFMDDNKNVGILGAKLHNSDGSSQLSAGNFYTFFNLFLTLFGADKFMRKSPSKIQKVDWVSGASFMIRRELFKKLKGFDQNFFMYIEDMELCFRAKKASFATYFYSDIDIIHKELGSGNREFAVLNIYKGILLFYKKHLNWQYPFVKFILFIKASLSFLIGVLTNNKYLKNTYFGALKISL